MRTATFRATILTIALVAPAVVAAGADAAGADDSTPPSEVPAPTAPPSGDTAIPAGTAAGDGSGDGGDTSLRTADAEFAVDMLLGLVPQDEMEAFWNEQEEQRQLAIQACMNEAGFEYNLENNMVYSDPYADLTPLEYAEQWGFGMWTSMDPDSPMNAMSGDYSWPNEDIVTALAESEQNAWYEVNSQCYNDASTESDDVYRNPMVQQALEDFYSDVENDPRVQDALDGWRDCMEAAGFPFASEEDMYTEVYGQGEDQWELQSQFYESEAWDPASPDHAEWQGLVDEEIGIAVANATCSPAVQDARDEVTADLRPGLVEVWQTVDWDLPPVTYEGEGDDMVFVGEGTEAIGAVDEGPGASDGDEPVAIDLSAGADSTVPAPVTP